MSRRTIRAAQLVSPFGPGSIVDLGTESFSCMDISHWAQGGCLVIRDNPLEPLLGKRVRMPPREASLGEVPIWRFPRWLFCPSCRRLYLWTITQDRAHQDGEPICVSARCNSATLNPMRFVVACEGGHLQDVDWFSWAHRNQQAATTGQCSRSTAELYFKTTGASGGDFNSMTVSCGSCRAKSTLQGLTDGPYIFGCAGRQPWHDSRQAERCDLKPRVFPRAASNVYYPETRSAIDLQAVEEVAGDHCIHNVRQWLDANPIVGTLRSMSRSFPGGILPLAVYEGLVGEVSHRFGIPEDQALTEVTAAISRTTIPTNETGLGQHAVENSQHGILAREWGFLSRARGITSKNLETSVITLRDEWPERYSEVFEQITLVSRLREVRALVGYRRVKPDSTSRLVPVDLGAGLDWVPGIESFGEGIFIKFQEDTLAQWEARVAAAFESRRKSLLKKLERWGRTPIGVYGSPRFIALHTFSHGLIRRLAFDAGYSAASIRERIYCDFGPLPAAGIMLYTVEGDSEGSLGGLVRQGRQDRLLLTIKRALADLAWCSSDPVCSELEEQGVDGLNAAACHACCLAPETSCTHNNSLLDRRLLTGSADLIGLMDGLIGMVA